MKKFCIFLIGVFCLVLSQSIFSQNIAHIPNDSMEYWEIDTLFGQVGEKPEHWFTPNNFFLNEFGIPFGVSKTTDSNTGEYAVRLENTSDISILCPVIGLGEAYELAPDQIGLIQGIPFPDIADPDVKIFLHFSYKGELSNLGDTSFIQVHFYNGDSPAQNIAYFTRYELVHPISQSEYTDVIQEVSFVANVPIDHLYVEIDMSRLGDTEQTVVGDFLQIDDLYFEYLSGIKIPLLSEYKVSIYPNPSFGNLTVEIEEPLVGKSRFSIYDPSGKKLKEWPLTAVINPIQVGSYSGAKFYQILDEAGRVVGGGTLILE